MVVAGQHYGYDNNEGEYVPKDGGARYFIEEMRPIDVDNGTNQSDCIRKEDSMPSLNSIAGKRKIGLTENEIRSNEIVCCTHCDYTCTRSGRALYDLSSLTSDHEPAGDIRQASSNTRRGQNSDPAVLSSSHGISGTNLSHSIRDSQCKETDYDPRVYHDGWASRLDSNDQDTAKSGPACHNAEAETDHAQKAKRALQLLLVPKTLENGIFLDILVEDLLGGHGAVRLIRKSHSLLNECTKASLKTSAAQAAQASIRACFESLVTE